MVDYLWHKISEEERKKIKDKTKSLILEFGDALEKLSEREDTLVEREKFERDEKDGLESDKIFREIMFKNAPNSKNECIIAEKGKWTE
ncbi:MAG: hypothetical protein QW727_01600 [Candidatus Pacearchaeota archaeon]